MKTLTKTDKHGHNLQYDIDIEDPKSELGFGGTGVVYKGLRTDLTLGSKREVAVKFLRDDLTPITFQRAKREAELRITNENLIEMIDFIEEVNEKGQHHYYVVSELIYGVMLFDLLKGKLESQDGEIHEEIQKLYDLCLEDRDRFAVFIVRHVLSAIMAMHDKGYIHRDIDPSNVMITDDGSIKLIDFGIAKNLSQLTTQDRQLTSTGEFVGKPRYAAPEMALGDVSHQNLTTDIYSLGIMFYELVTGEPPYDGPDHEVLRMQIHKKFPLENIANKSIRAIIGKATQKDQAKRYKSAFEFRVALDQLRWQDDDHHSKTWVTWAVISAIGVLLGILAGIFL
jgi:serine/threonine-protein kinase